MALLAGSSENLDPESDLLPEYCHYRDEGCDLAPACLECPFPDCIRDLPEERAKQVNKARNDNIVNLYRKQSVPAGTLAAQFHVSERTVYYILSQSP